MILKKVVIDIRPFLTANKIKEKTVCEEIGISRITLFTWRNEAPELAKLIYKVIEQNPKVDFLKAMKGWEEPPIVLAFIRDFMEKYKCKLHDIVFEK